MEARPPGGPVVFAQCSLCLKRGDQYSKMKNRKFTNTGRPLCSAFGCNVNRNTCLWKCRDPACPPIWWCHEHLAVHQTLDSIRARAVADDFDAQRLWCDLQAHVLSKAPRSCDECMFPVFLSTEGFEESYVVTFPLHQYQYQRVAGSGEFGESGESVFVLLETVLPQLGRTKKVHKVEALGRAIRASVSTLTPDQFLRLRFSTLQANLDVPYRSELNRVMLAT